MNIDKMKNDGKRGDRSFKAESGARTETHSVAVGNPNVLVGTNKLRC